MTRFLALDLETTGTDTAMAKIVEVALCGAEGPVFESRVDPCCHIPAEATAIHGITDAGVAGAPRFSVIAPTVQQHLEGVGLVGYNHRAFDVIILNRELREAGQAGIDLDKVREIDLYRVWNAAEPRSLAGALKRFLDVEHVGAHGAIADTAVLAPLMTAMQETFGLSLEEMIALSRPANEVDRSGKLRRREDGAVVFTFGKYKDQPIAEYLDYCDWMLHKADFPADTKAALRALMPQEQGEPGEHDYLYPHDDR